MENLVQKMINVLGNIVCMKYVQAQDGFQMMTIATKIKERVVLILQMIVEDVIQIIVIILHNVMEDIVSIIYVGMPPGEL
jgi:hypothetical protein